MEILKGFRKCGKTSYCIKKAYKENAIIVTGNMHMKHCIEDQAKKMMMPVKVYSLYEIIEGRMFGRIENQKIIIDQLEHILYALFRGHKIDIITTDIEVLNFPNWNKKSYSKLLENIKNQLKKNYKLFNHKKH